MEECPGEQHGCTGCWGESVEVPGQGSYSKISLVSLEEGEGDSMRSCCVQGGKDSANDDGQLQCSDESRFMSWL